MRKVLFAALILFSCRHTETKTQAANEDKFYYDCSSSREFSTAFEYLRTLEKGSKLKSEFEKMALSVSSGCSGAAERFIVTSQLLIKAGLDSRGAVTIARDIAVEGPIVTRAFQDVFKSAYAKEFLDMDVGSAVRLAKDFSIKLDGNPAIVGEDFSQMARYCVSAKGLNLPKPKCAELVGKMARYNAKRDIRVGYSLEDFVSFARDTDGPNLAMHDVVVLADKLISASPIALKEFKNAYEYSIDKDGLALERTSSIKMATDIAMHSRHAKFKYE